MKHKTLSPRTIPVLASLLLTMLCAIGCTQEDPSEFPGSAPNDSDEPIPVTIAFNGVETMFGSYGAETRNLQANKIHFSQEYDKTRMIETIVMADPDTLQVPLDPSTRGSLASTTLRIVAYDAKNTEYQGTGVFNIDEDGKVTPNSDETLTLKKGDYIFHCFSPAEEIAVSGDKATVTVTLPKTEGTVDPKSYYAVTETVTVTPPTSAGTCSVLIPRLKPQYCKLTLSVSAPEGKKVTYESAKLTTTLYQQASLALPGGTVTSANSSPSTTTIHPASPTIYTYPGGTGKFKITLTNVIVANESKEIAPLISNGGLTMTTGNAYKVNVKFEKKNWIKVDAIPFKVATGNLIGPGAGGAFNKNKNGNPKGKWQIGPDQGWGSGLPNGGDYFNWGVRDPLCAGSASVDYCNDALDRCPWGPISGVGNTYKNQLNTNANPCFLAMGAGWHVPTPEETNAMFSVPFCWGTYSSLSKGTIVEGMYLGTISPIGEPAQDAYVFLPANGLRDYSPVEVIKLNYGFYWSSGPLDYNKDFAYPIKFNSTEHYAGTNTRENRSRGMGIRCVSY